MAGGPMSHGMRARRVLSKMTVGYSWPIVVSVSATAAASYSP
jgi:hypothetical protein